MNSRTQTMTFLGVGTLAILGLGACATVSPGSRPDDMSAAKHHATAEGYEAKAAEHEALYDPDAKATRIVHIGGVGGRRGDVDGDTGETYRTYNPTKKHFGHAKEFREHSRQHAAAAGLLDNFEDANCRQIRQDARSICPLMGGVVERVEDIENGARLFIADDTETEAVAAHMKCHYAFGRKHGHKGMDTCPLYLKGISIKVSGRNSVDVVAEDPTVVSSLRKRSKNHVGARLETKVAAP